MRGVAIHGTLLVLALVFAYQTWTRDTGASTRRDEVTVWRGSPDRITSITYEQPGQTLAIERRGEGSGYLWGTVRRPPSVTDSAAPGREGLEEFPIGERGTDLLSRLAPLTALRDLGTVGDTLKAEFGLVSPDRKLTVIAGENTRSLDVGGTVYGGGHRYALDPASGRGYVLSSDLLRQLEGGQSALRLTELHEFEVSGVAAVTVRTAGGERTLRREGGGELGSASWMNEGSTDPDQTFANFMERLQGFSVITYVADLDPDTLDLRVRVDYLNQRREPLGFLEVFRGRRGEGVEYFIRTERTRIPARTHPSIGERVDGDLEQLF